MAVFQRMDVNTLKLRNLIFKNPDESPIPANYQLLSKGDGNTVWSPSVDVKQFIALNEKVSTLFHHETIFNNIYKPAISTATSNFNVDTYTSIITDKILSSDSIIFSQSTITNRVLNPLMPRINQLLDTQHTTIRSYLDDKLSDFQQIIETHNSDSNINAIKIADATVTGILTIEASVQNYLESEKATEQLKTQMNTYFQTNTPNITKKIETITHAYLQSSDNNLDSIFNNFLISEKATINLDTAVNKYFNKLDNAAKIDASVHAYFSSSDSVLIKPLTVAVNNIFSSDSIMETLFRADNINSAFKSALNEIISSDSILENVLQSEFVAESLVTMIETILSSDSIMNAMAIYTDTTLSNFSTNQAKMMLPLLQFSPDEQASTNTAISLNLSTLNTFSTVQISTNNFFIENFSTMTKTGLTSKLYQTFIELEAYSVTIIESTISNVNSQFTTIISSQTGGYISTTRYLANSTYTSVLQSNVYSTIQYIYPSTQSTLVGLQSFWNSTINTNISTLLLKGFADPTNITVNGTYNLSTITSAYSITGLNSLSTSAINLDLRTADNFYCNFSDIGQNVYYGLTYTTDSTIKNRNITLELDFRSSYKNNFSLLDTENLSNWLTKPAIYYPQNSSGLIISSFIGKYVVDMRCMNNILHIKNIYTYPYIYSNLTSTQDPITIQQNITPSTNPSSYTFIYAGTKFNLAWTTNDLNIPLGVRFSGPDPVNPSNRIMSWSGPYPSGPYNASITVPSNLPYAIYDTIHLMVYPFSGVYNPLNGNLPTNTKIFDSRPLTPNLAVVKPNSNTTIRIYNPGNVHSFLDVQDISVYSVTGINLTRPNTGTIITMNSSTPFQNDHIAWAPQNIIDGNPNTEFKGGIDLSSGPDLNAFIEMKISPSTIYNTTLISSIVITGSSLPNFTLNNMKLLIHNTYPNNLSVSSIQTLTRDYVQTIIFS